MKGKVVVQKTEKIPNDFKTVAVYYRNELHTDVRSFIKENTSWVSSYKDGVRKIQIGKKPAPRVVIQFSPERDTKLAQQKGTVESKKSNFIQMLQKMVELNLIVGFCTYKT